MRLGLVLSACLLTVGCVYDRDGEEIVPAGGGDGSLVINITRGAVGQTRSTDITDPETAKTSERQIQTMAIAVFRASDAADGNASKCVYFKYLTGINQAATGFTTTVDNIYNGTASKQILSGDSVFVVTNVPSDVFTSVSVGTTTVTQFKELKATTDQALDPDGDNAVDPVNLPMYGSARVTTSGTKLIADVDVRHMVSKVTLEQLSVEGLASGATFTPTQVFLYNVADKMQFNFQTENTVSTYNAPSHSDWWQGEATNAANLKACLGTGTLSEMLDSDDGDATNPSVLTNKYVLYALPNTSSTNRTKLVIKGQWIDGTNSAPGVTRYYTFDLFNVVNGVADQPNLYPNRNYRMKIILKREGAETVLGTVATQANTAVTLVTVSEWGDGEQTTTFGEAGSSSTTNS